MFSSHKSFVFFPFKSVVFFLLLAGTGSLSIHAQEGIPWLEEYTSEMEIGSDKYRYSFSTVDGNECKLEFKETVTDKKGANKTRSWVFYLSDIDPSGLDFKPRGKSIQVTMETVNGQEFISFYEEGTFEEYTDEIIMSMSDVAVTRRMLETIREKIGPCREGEVSWEDREAAFDWLTGNIGEAVDGDVRWEQQFSRAEKPYLARLIARSTDKKGVEGSYEYMFDLSDIDSSAVRLEVSGVSLSVEAPVKGGEDLVGVKTAGGTEYADEVRIFADDIEMARQMVHALSYLTANTTAERPEWSGYTDALEFVEENLAEVKIDDETFSYSISYDGSPSGVIELNVTETGSDGAAEEMTYAFYLTDMEVRPALEVGSDEVMVEMKTRDDRDFIRKISGGSITGYTSSLEFHATGIDVARDLVGALETAIRKSEEEIEEFSSAGEVNDWMEENLVELSRGDETYEQRLRVDPENSLQIIFERKVTDEDGSTENRYLVYPEDISLEELKIGVRMGRMNVAVETDEDDYIRHFRDGELQDFTDDVDVYFSDPLTAKNFMAAIRFLKTEALAAGTTEMSREDAVSFLKWNIPQVEVPGMIYKQELDIPTGSECSLRFTRVETEEGESEEYAYEFMAQDIDPQESEISVDGELVEINLTTGSQKLIKPFENGEVEDFDDELTIYADDVLLAKKILAAIAVLSAACE